MTVLRYGETAGREVSKRIAAPVANIAALKLIGAKDCANGQEVRDISTGKLYSFNDSSVVTADDQLVIATASGTGNWLLNPGFWDLSFPFTFATADATALYTLPTGAFLIPEDFYWEVLTNLTGGASSAIGVSSAKTNFTAKGALLGGAAGDVAATLVASGGRIFGTIGSGFDTLAKRRAIWKAADILARYDLITSQFTAGTGNVHAMVKLLANAGA